MTFYAIELDICPAYGWQAGPTAKVRIRALRNGHERRNRFGDLLKHSFILPFQNVKDVEYLAYIKAAFMALGGPTDSFLVKDFADHTATSETLGAAPAGVESVQLQKTYSFGVASYVRPIEKPVAGAVIYQDTGSGPVAIAGTLDTLTGLFVPDAAWTEGAALTWTGQFRVAVRFEDFFLPATIDNRSGSAYVMNSSCSLIEVHGE